MPSSRKTYRIPSGQELPSDNLSIASGSSSSTLPPHLRGWSSTVSGPPYNDASGSKLPPHLRSHQPRSVSSDQNVNQKSIEKAQQPENEDPPSPQSATAAPRVAVQSNFIRDRPFACTFEGCDKIFKTKALLIKHKVADEEGHDYCRVCDLDFKDDDSFHNHKVSSEAHICCPVCSEDFKSEGGRDRHFTQMHSMAQHLHCRGCGKEFHKGAALMSHIEKNQCPGIRKEDFEAQRALVAIGLHKACQTGPDSIGIMSLVPSTAEESSVGGVPVTDSILDENEPPSELNKNMPSLGRIDSNDSSDMSTASANRIRGYENSYPALNSVQDKGKGKQHRTSGSVTGNDEKPDSISLTWSQHNFPDAPRTPAIANWNQVPASDTSYVNTIDALSGQLGHFRIIDMKPDSADGLYHCPFDKCRESTFTTRDQVSLHLRSGIHQGAEHRCVGCLRVFKTPSALTAHMESSSERCHVRESKQFGNALSLVSGGFLGVNGRHADGTVKIDTPARAPINW